ncbi:MAG: hypothetical protein HFJ94_06845 [Muribaculaceae bacterium]|nr:hypothetical protein [Muribaculaceae bacterium]
MRTDLNERERLNQIDCIFYREVKQSALNIISDNPDLDEENLRKLIAQIIEKYFDKTIGVKKMEMMLSARECIYDPVIFLKESKRKYLLQYRIHPLPRINSNTTLQKIAVISEELEKKIDEALKERPKLLGFCHLYWATKKRILFEDYGIVWYSPADCNPGIFYD